MWCLLKWPLEALQTMGAKDCGPTAAFPILISLRLLTSFPAGLAVGHLSAFSLLWCFIPALVLPMFFLVLISLFVSLAKSVYWSFTNCLFPPFFLNSSLCCDLIVTQLNFPNLSCHPERKSHSQAILSK